MAGLGATAACAAAIGVVLAIDVQNKHNQYAAASCDKLWPQPDVCGGIAQSGHTEADASIVLYSVGGSLAAAALATWFIWPNAPARSSWTLRPSFDGRTATAVFAGSF